MLSVSCFGGCAEKVNTKESTDIQKEQKTEEKTFQGLEDNTVFDVLWEDKEGCWFAGNASCVLVDGIEEPILLTAYHLFSDEETVGDADSGYKANVMKQKIGGTLYDIKDWDRESFMAGTAEFENMNWNQKITFCTEAVLWIALVVLIVKKVMKCLRKLCRWHYMMID